MVGVDFGELWLRWVFSGFAGLVVDLGGLVLSSFVGCLYRLLVARSCGVRLCWCC